MLTVKHFTALDNTPVMRECFVAVGVFMRTH